MNNFGWNLWVKLNKRKCPFLFICTFVFHSDAPLSSLWEFSPFTISDENDRRHVSDKTICDVENVFEKVSENVQKNTSKCPKNVQIVLTWQLMIYKGFLRCKCKIDKLNVLTFCNQFNSNPILSLFTFFLKFPPSQFDALTVEAL